MIPVKLYLQNFMAYQAPETLDFNGIHIAVLIGENGAGKSAILDAMTWVLWGKARTRLDDDLIHLGQSEMEVEFTFDLGDERYRILRRRNSSKRGRSELHFHIWDAGGWRTLTETSIKLTQAKINRLLRLDYDTFINSAFLLQGRANEFTTRKPAERKQILGEILGLGIYDEYEEKAGQKVRHYNQEVKIMEAQLQQMEQEMANEALYRAEWEEGQNKAAALNKLLRDTETTLDTLRHQHQELDIKHRQLTDLRERLQQAQRDIDDLAQTINTLRGNAKRYQTIIDQKDKIEKGRQKLLKAQSEQEDWNERLSKSSSLSTELHQLETTINQARAKLEADLKIKQTRLNELKPKAAAIPNLETELEKLQSELNALQSIETEREANREQLNALNTKTARLQEENKQLKTEMNKIKERLTQLDEAGSTCPVCTQPLSDAHREEVRSQFTGAGTEKGDTFRTNKGELGKIKREQQALNTAIKKAAQTLKKRAATERRHAQLEQQLQEAKTARQNLGVIETELTALQTKFNGQDFEAEARSAAGKIKEKLATVGYNAHQHQAVRKSVAELSRFAEEFRQLEETQTRLQEITPRLEAEETRHARLLIQTAADREMIDRLTEETKTLAQLARDLSAASAKVDDLQRQDRLARDEVAAARQKLDHLAYLAKERGNKEDALADLKLTRGIYQELKGAFGKKGVQALLIEHAIPELEDEANAILSRMTDGRMNLQFITQRAAKTTDATIETLDIRIADELGTRNYDLYSGGEAFRVNFAVRIALSKLLARRAGASLQTLVIDEGFGTQDAQGRERLVDAIKTIQADFEKIIVITHIDELKDAFPTRINIQKTEHGSTISVA